MTNLVVDAHRKVTDVNGAAEYCCVHPATIRRWIAEGLLPARRMGPRLIRIQIADLAAMINPIGA